ncbi:MAG: bifunctional DNA-binding transcriptional regulator/O6-methylguanine-DNA methyltransferase Ada [Granulosicoccus sp.]
MVKQKTEAFNTDQQRWRAVQQRNATADTSFFYGVLTTGIYCYPSCPSRGARRENVRFYLQRQYAIDDGLRACKRCKSDQAPLAQRRVYLIERACRLIEQSEQTIRIESIAERLAISRFHLQRLFKQQTGITPKAYEKAIRANRLQANIRKSQRVTDTIYDSGYSSASGFYAEAAQRLGMTPSTAKRGGEGLSIHYAFAMTSLGKIIVAATTRGICVVRFGESDRQLLAGLKELYPKAQLALDKQGLKASLAQVVTLIESPASEHRLPLDIRGTVFQEKVWAALRKIPAGSTASYSEVARSIGKPTAMRAVAQACGANPVAVLIPCHRVVRADGGLSGYRWGVERKAALLKGEKPDE